MKKSMFLVEVRCCLDHSLFKRRIAETYYDVEDWLDNNADKWAHGVVKIDCDDYCCGKIYYNDKPMYIFEIHNIAVV